METVRLYQKDGCPACAQAREFLSQKQIPYTAYDVAGHPLNAQATLEVIRPCRRFFVKVGEDVFVWDRDQEEVPEEALRRHFVHLDGFIRTPVLIVGTTAAVRGFLPDVYSELFALSA
jgi:glutaredoxin